MADNCKYSRREAMAAGAAVASLVSGRQVAAQERRPGAGLVSFAAPWTSPYRVDPVYRHHLVNAEGQRLFILNKTAWAYFGCKDPAGVVQRAKAQGCNVLRVALEGTPYFPELGIEMWPWGGTRAKPEWSRFNEAYWEEVERRVRLAGEHGLGLDVTVYFTLKPDAKDAAAHRAYWDRTLRLLGQYANVLTWEMANEYVRNEGFQDAAGTYFKANDPCGRPVCTSDGTTDDAVWAHKPWVDLAINHSCTSSTERHPLREWYLAVARNTRAHGKPAWCNESGREKRHQNDDPIHRRKQGWLWCAAGAFWTYHSWEGCEGIDDPEYRGPGQEFLRPMAEFFRSLPFWRLDPCHTALTARDAALVEAALADPERRMALSYLCTPDSGRAVSGGKIFARLPRGEYEAAFIEPATGRVMGTLPLRCEGLNAETAVALPRFTDDLAVRIRLLKAEGRRPLPGTG